MSTPACVTRVTRYSTMTQSRIKSKVLILSSALYILYTPPPSRPTLVRPLNLRRHRVLSCIIAFPGRSTTYPRRYTHVWRVGIPYHATPPQWQSRKERERESETGATSHQFYRLPPHVAAAKRDGSSATTRGQWSLRRCALGYPSIIVGASCWCNV